MSILQLGLKFIRISKGFNEIGKALRANLKQGRHPVSQTIRIRFAKQKNAIKLSDKLFSKIRIHC